MPDPIEFLRDQFPKIFSRGVQLLKERANRGDPSFERRLTDVCDVSGSFALSLDARAPVYLSVSRGEIIFSEQAIAGSPIKLIAQVPGPALGVLLGRAMKEGALQSDEVAIGAASLVSKRLEDMLAGRPMSFRLQVQGVPELGQVSVLVGFNVSEIPAQPGFSATLNYSDLELAQAAKISMQDLFMGGKLKMEGDYSTALQIAVQLMTNPL